MYLEYLVSKITKIPNDYLPNYLKNNEIQKNPVWNLYMTILFSENKNYKKTSFSLKFNHTYYQYFGKSQNEIDNFDELMETIITILKTEGYV